MSSLGRILEPVLETRDTTGERLGRASGLECNFACVKGKDMLGSLSVRMSSLGRILEPVLETRDTTGERLGRASGLEVLCCSALMNIELEIKNTYVIPDSS
ncbi:hypothetical protein NDU88_001177 [Pleurodeles waltl]|uniref:Uncharacterized protein n=1 Tax=Pleurodeles waltl TaxID=8319 RepID=A0AAV7NBN7_PLEWA|nr:hypothetical protein NDU88_001177 [Pleurodeles waltl]